MNCKALLILFVGAGLLVGCESYNHGHSKGTPGHIMQATGYNPASGKFHGDNPGKGKGKAKGKKKGW